jgi:hypothetical protein
VVMSHERHVPSWSTEALHSRTDSLLRDRDVDACLARAEAWFHHCGNDEAQPVTATYVVLGESRTFPPTQAPQDPDQLPV